MSIKTNAIRNSMLYVFKYAIPLFTFSYLTRALSKKSIGDIFFIDSIVQYLLIFASIGIYKYGTREVAKLSDNNSEKFKTAAELIIIQFLLSSVIVIIFVNSPLIFPQLAEYWTLIKIGSISIIASPFVIEWYYEGIEGYKYITYRGIISKILSSICIITLVNTDADNNVYYFITNTFILLNAVFNFSIFLKLSPKKTLFKPNFKRHFKALRTIFLLNLTIGFYTLFDAIILKFFTDSETLSTYTIPLKIVKIYLGLILSIGYVIVPRISKYYAKNDYKSIDLLTQKTLNITILLSVPFILSCLLLPKEILTLIAGNNYASAYPVLMSLSPLPLIIGISSVISIQYLIPSGREKIVLHATIIGATASLILNLLLTPHLSYYATVLAYLSAEIIILFVIYRHSRSEISLKIDKTIIYNAILSSLLTFSVWLLLKHNVDGILLILAVLISYLIFFAIFHFLVFKSLLVKELYNFKTSKQNE